MNKSYINKSAFMQISETLSNTCALFRIMANLELRHVHVSRNLRSPRELIRRILKSDTTYAHASLNSFFPKRRKTITLKNARPGDLLQDVNATREIYITEEEPSRNYKYERV